MKMWDVSIVVEDNCGYLVSDSSGDTYYMTYREYNEFRDSRKERMRKSKLKDLLDGRGKEKESENGVDVSFVTTL